MEATPFSLFDGNILDNYDFPVLVEEAHKGDESHLMRVNRLRPVRSPYCLDQQRQQFFQMPDFMGRNDLSVRVMPCG